MSFKNIVVSVCAAAAFSTFAMAQGGQQPNQPPREMGMGRGGGGREAGERGMGGMGRGMRKQGGMDFSRLNLTDAQKQRIQSLMDNSKKTMESNKAQFEEMGKLMRLKREGLLTTEQGTRLTSLQAQMKTNGDKMQSDLLAILTPEQRVLVEQMKNDRGGRMKGMRDKMQQRGPGGQNRMNRPGRPNGGQNQPPPPPTQN